VALPEKTLGGENDVTVNKVVLPVALLEYPCAAGQNIFVAHQQKLSVFEVAIIYVNNNLGSGAKPPGDNRHVFRHILV